MSYKLFASQRITDPFVSRLDAELERVRQIHALRERCVTLFNGQGFVKLVNAYGTDDTVIEAARLTAQSEGKTIEGDRGLLRYLFRKRHASPFEFCVATFHVRVPMDLWRQSVRHRTQAINEYSQRYSPAIDEMMSTPPIRWRRQSTSNRQGSSNEFIAAEDFPEDFNRTGPLFGGEPPQHAGEYLSYREDELHELAREVYQERLRFGVAKEQARKDLPLSNFTEAYFIMNLRNMMHFLSLRMDSHAQKEIRDMATAIGEEFIAKLFPETWQAFLDYDFNAMELTALDKRAIQHLMDASERPGNRADADAMFTPIIPNKRERGECVAKMLELGLLDLFD